MATRSLGLAPTEPCAQARRQRRAKRTGAPDSASTGTSAVGDRRPRELLRPWPDADLLRRSAARCAAVFARFARNPPATPTASPAAAIPIPLRRQPPPAAILPGPGGARAEFLGSRRKRRRPAEPPVEGARTTAAPWSLLGL